MAKQPNTKKSSQRWCRNVADEKALEAGCLFDEKLGQFVVDWCANCLCLYEGEFAGEPVVFSDWQYEATMRLFSWVRWSDRYKRWVRRFRTAAVWVPKKNKKSPTLAAWGLYLTCGDGEDGQKVYFGAKDGAQAREIAGKHAIEMVRSSPQLNSECKINLTLGQVEHIATRSIMKPMSSGDERTQKSKEGLNGSMLVDEVHVVDKAFMDRISRAGISRSEPLQIEVSTAGNDPTSYGKERWDYGEALNRGDHDNLHHLHMSYHAPQNVTDAELAADPIKFGKMANPAWGHTIDPEEYLADYKRSCSSASELALFKMYRLNIWQGSSMPWLNLDKWGECGQDAATLLPTLEGRECYGGLDLSRTTDSTALTLCFPPEQFEGEYVLVSFFWLPEVMGRAMNDKVPYLNWAKTGHITLTEGNVMDYGFVRDFITGLSERFDLRKLYYDPYNATHLAQELVNKHGVPCEEFGQTIANLAEPTKELERLTLDCRIAHPNNPVMNWQISVCTVKSDGNGNIKIVKQKPGDYRKVDGPVSAVMALAGALQPSGGSYYDQPDSEVEII